ncbi:MAG TPA: hypothetical protein VF941_13395 [Clostridia bacterium]
MSSDIINMLLGNYKDKRPAHSHESSESDSSSTKSEESSNPCGLTAQKLLVIAGLLADVLEVESILVDVRQRIEIVLVGSLKQGKSTDNVMEQLGKMPFEQVIKTLVEKIM